MPPASPSIHSMMQASSAALSMLAANSGIGEPHVGGSPVILSSIMLPLAPTYGMLLQVEATLSTRASTPGDVRSGGVPPWMWQPAPAQPPMGPGRLSSTVMSDGQAPPGSFPAPL